MLMDGDFGDRIPGLVRHNRNARLLLHVLALLDVRTKQSLSLERQRLRRRLMRPTSNSAARPEVIGASNVAVVCQL